MRIYVVRHGKAERDSPTGRDEDRPLRPRGIRQARWLGVYLAALPEKHRPELILSSPLARALDTARTLHQALRCPLDIAPELSTASSCSAILQLIDARRALGALALVGHNPLLEEVVAAMLDAGSAKPPGLRTGEAIVIDLKKGARLLAGGVLIEVLRDDPGEDD